MKYAVALLIGLAALIAASMTLGYATAKIEQATLERHCK